MKFQPGQSGNPKGRKPKDRTLTNFLEKAGKGKISWKGEDKLRAEVLAEVVWQGLMSGVIVLPDGKKPFVLSPSDWKDFVKWLYNQVDGPPKQEMDFTTDGKTINHLTEEERLTRIVVVLDKARERVARQAADHGSRKGELQAPTKAG